MNPAPGVVIAASRARASHHVSKRPASLVRLVAGLGVAGGARLAVTVQHRSRAARDPSSLNLRQVHLIHSELHDELRDRGFDVAPDRWART